MNDQNQPQNGESLPASTNPSQGQPEQGVNQPAQPQQQQPVQEQPQQPQSQQQYAAGQPNPQQPGQPMPPVQKQPNSFVEALKAQWTAVMHVKDGVPDLAIETAKKHSLFWVITFALLSFSYGLFGVNLINGPLGYAQKLMKDAIGAYGFGYAENIKITLSAGGWFSIFITVALIAFALLVLRAVFINLNSAKNGIQQNFTDGANSYASLLVAQIPVILLGALLLFIPAFFVIILGIVLVFICANAIGFFAEVALYTRATRNNSNGKQTSGMYIGLMAAWFTVLSLGLYIYYAVGAENFKSMISNLTSYLN